MPPLAIAPAPSPGGEIHPPLPRCRFPRPHLPVRLSGSAAPHVSLEVTRAVLGPCAVPMGCADLMGCGDATVCADAMAGLVSVERIVCSKFNQSWRLRPMLTRVRPSARIRPASLWGRLPRKEYFDGRTLKEAIINATCTKSGPAPTSTQPPVVETTTQMQAGATTTTTAQVEEANVIETMTRTTTTAAPAGTTAGTATSAPATSAGTTAPATAGATTATATAAATTTAATTATTADGATTAAATTAATAATTASAATTAAAATTAGATTAVVTAAGTTVTAAGTTSEVATTRSEVATTTPVTSAVTTTAASPGTSAGEAPATTGALGQADGPTTTPPPGCGGVPSVLNAVDVSPCADLPSGSSCKVRSASERLGGVRDEFSDWGQGSWSHGTAVGGVVNLWASLSKQVSSGATFDHPSVSLMSLAYS